MAMSSGGRFVTKYCNLAARRPGPGCYRALASALGLGFLASLAACQGEIGTPMGRGNTTGGSPATTGGPGATTGPGGTTTGSMTGGATTGGTTTGGGSGLGLPPAMTPTARLHKLTTMEFANSLHDLLGSAAPVPSVEPDLIVEGFATIGASSVAISPSGVGLYQTGIPNATAFAFADATHAASVLPCVPQSMTDMTCFTRAISE